MAERVAERRGRWTADRRSRAIFGCVAVLALCMIAPPTRAAAGVFGIALGVVSVGLVAQLARPQAKSAEPTKSPPGPSRAPSGTPAGTAHRPEPVWRRYSLRASSRARRVCIGTYWVRGSRT